MVESTSNTPYEDHPGLHSSRNFVVTPPQTESAQILLSLARSHNQKLFSSHIDSDGTLTNGVDDESGDSVFLNRNQHDGGNGVVGFDQQSRQQQEQQLQQHSINNSNILFDEHNLILSDSNSNGSLISMGGHRAEVVEAENGGKSLLAKLLTRNNHEAEQATTTYAKSTLYEVTRDGKVASNPLTAADLQPSIILECPFLIETTDGAYVDVCVENMLNSLDGSASVPVTIPMPTSSEPEPEADAVSETIIADPAVLDRIRHDTAPELEIDPEAVVLTKISEDGRVEKYVLSSADVQALKQMNERLAAAASTSGRPSPADLATEIETPGSSDSPLITKILVDGTGGIQNAINRLPFKKTVLGCGSASGSSSGQGENAADGLHQAILDSSLTVDDAHHHENMFEELDNQFNTMDCCAIDDEEHIRRDYVAYEEASKNETQLEHNYYANALKDEDEEGVVIADGQYDLRMMMMIEETPTTGQQPQSNDTGVAKSSNNKKRYQNVQLLGTTAAGPDICLNGNTLVSLGPSKTAPTTLRINGAGNLASADKPIIVVPPNGSGAAAKCDLIINDALMSSVLNVAAEAANLGKSNTPTTAAKRKLSADNVLPFKSVKSASTFRNSTNSSKKSSPTVAAKRTYNKRKTNASNHNQSKKMAAPLNGTFSNENNLIEEIIVDEIS